MKREKLREIDIDFDLTLVLGFLNVREEFFGEKVQLRGIET